MASRSCGCDSVCQYEVEVKVIDIQPVERDNREKGEGQISDDLERSEMDYTCKELERFNVTVSFLFFYFCQSYKTCNFKALYVGKMILV